MAIKTNKKSEDLKILSLFVTYPNKKIAQKVSKILVEERLVACANIGPTIDSIYQWNGKLQQDKEVIVIYKTNRGMWDRVRKMIQKLHPYECPCILGTEVSKSFEGYQAWLSSNLNSNN